VKIGSLEQVFYNFQHKFLEYQSGLIYVGDRVSDLIESQFTQDSYSDFEKEILNQAKKLTADAFEVRFKKQATPKNGKIEIGIYLYKTES